MSSHTISWRIAPRFAVLSLSLGFGPGGCTAAASSVTGGARGDSVVGGIENAPPGPPCTVAADCWDTLAVSGAGADALIMPFYRTFSPAEPNAAITRAVVVVHGNARDASTYFDTMVSAVRDSGQLESTLVIAPHFQGTGCATADTPGDGELYWGCGGWIKGDDARNGSDENPISSYDVLDRFVELLGDRTKFPALVRITLTGHSAGGQYLQRYAASTRIDARVSVPIRFVVANPSSLMYLSDARLAAGATCSPAGTCTGAFETYTAVDDCPDFDTYKFGLQNRLRYPAAVTDDEIRRQFTARAVTYMLGDEDTLEHAAGTSMDTGCEANLQGVDRRSRGINFWSYMRSTYGAKHALVIVPKCRHSGECMYTSAAGRKTVLE